MLRAVADTHAVIWYIFGDSRLSKTATDAWWAIRLRHSCDSHTNGTTSPFRNNIDAKERSPALPPHPQP